MFINIIRNGQRVVRLRREDSHEVIVEELEFPTHDAMVSTLIFALVNVVEQLNPHSPAEDFDIVVPSGSPSN